jgi:hypothetical protein
VQHGISTQAGLRLQQEAISDLLCESLTELKRDRENAEKRLSMETRRLDLEEKMMETEREDRVLDREAKREMIELLRSLSSKN